MTGCGDRQIHRPGKAHLWSTRTGHPIGSPMRHDDCVIHAEFDRSGSLVVTAGQDGAARVWEARTAEPVSPPLHHPDEVRIARFVQSQRAATAVLTRSGDGVVRLWQLTEDRRPAPDLRLLAERLAARQLDVDGTLIPISSDRYGQRTPASPPLPILLALPLFLDSQAPPTVTGGRAFMESIASLPNPEREAAILKEVGAGNIPGFLRTFKTVTLAGMDTRGEKHTVQVSVMPDYLAVGSDADFVRVPMTPQTAQRLADSFGCALPTRKIVDAIHRQADVKLEPRPMTRDRESVATFLEHNQLIEQERIRDGRPLGALVSGTKKDVVVTPRLQERPGRVAIYGWHKLDGQPIQPLTTVHVASYVDYSHGIRLVRQTVLIDGKPHVLSEVLKNPVLHVLLSDEGALESVSY